jgi:hypothetical protein
MHPLNVSECQQIGVHVERVGFHYTPGGAALESRSAWLKSAAMDLASAAIHIIK